MYEGVKHFCSCQISRSDLDGANSQTTKNIFSTKYHKVATAILHKKYKVLLNSDMCLWFFCHYFLRNTFHPGFLGK